MPKSLIKYRTIALQKGDVNAAKMIDVIKRVRGVISFQYESDSLYIGYDLGQCDYQHIYYQLRQQGLVCRQTGWQQLKRLFISFMEHNERCYASTPGGWDYYLQVLYLSSDRGT